MKKKKSILILEPRAWATCNSFSSFFIINFFFLMMITYLFRKLFFYLALIAWGCEWLRESFVVGTSVSAHHKIHFFQIEKKQVVTVKIWHVCFNIKGWGRNCRWRTHWIRLLLSLDYKKENEKLLYYIPCAVRCHHHSIYPSLYAILHGVIIVLTWELKLKEMESFSPLLKRKKKLTISNWFSLSL